MKQSRSILCLVWLLSLTCACADDTAYQALKVVRTAKGDDLLKSLVEISGESGDPQPGHWKMLFNDPTARGGVREIIVENGTITSERTPLRGFAGVGDLPAMNPSVLTIDSDKVFHMAENQAVKYKLGFHRLDYTLHAGGDTTAPLWTVRLYDNMGATVGKMEVSAVSGDIVQPLTVDVDYVKTPQASSPEEESSLRDRWQEGGGLIGKVEDVTKRTGDTIKHTTLRVGGAVQEFFTGERTIDEDNNNH